jgi:glutamine amidotransferase
MTTIAVIDHGAGNLVSMEQALHRAGADKVIVIDAATGLTGCDGVVLPGVGATGPAMRSLRRAGFVEALRSHDGPLLGVCVGMQLLFDHSLEDRTDCLGLLAGEVRAVSATPLPHMGWNDVDPVISSGTSVAGLSSGPFYFVHSFVPEPSDPSVIMGTTTYQEDTFASVVRRGLVIGIQFHPERSASGGLDVLRGFVDMCRGVARAA